MGIDRYNTVFLYSYTGARTRLQTLAYHWYQGKRSSIEWKGPTLLLRVFRPAPRQAGVTRRESPVAVPRGQGDHHHHISPPIDGRGECSVRSFLSVSRRHPGGPRKQGASRESPPAVSHCARSIRLDPRPTPTIEVERPIGSLQAANAREKGWFRDP